MFKTIINYFLQINNNLFHIHSSRATRGTFCMDRSALQSAQTNLGQFWKNEDARPVTRAAFRVLVRWPLIVSHAIMDIYGILCFEYV